ncbi:hypothetical protein [Hymenobacter koreensis]|uniref:PorT family protein n=1 Tax=Hymenobacter koreensis TaxID=1084523 RepID=A0ABP8IVG4_9BACT
MKTPLLLVALLFVSGVSLAQSEFRPGYIVPLTGDTLRGEVDFRGAQRNSTVARFRATATATPESFQPDRLRGYGFRNGKVYEAQTLTPPNGTAARYFAEVLEQGKMSLYYLTDAKGKELYYVAVQGQEPVLLEKRTEKVVLEAGTTSERKVMQENNLYRATLASLMTDCPAVRVGLIRLSYAESKLRETVRSYNACVGSSPAPRAVQSGKQRVVFGLTAGVNKSSLTYSSSTTTDEKDDYTSPIFGLTLSKNLSRQNDRISGQAALLHEHVKFTTPRRPNSFWSTPSRSIYDASYLRLPISVRYTFPTGAVRPFVQIGFTNAYAYKLKNQEQVQLGGPDNYGPLQTGENVQRRYEQALNGGLGLKTERIDKRDVSLLLQVERGNGFSEATGVRTRLVRVHGLLLFDITK